MSYSCMFQQSYNNKFHFFYEIRCNFACTKKTDNWKLLLARKEESAQRNLPFKMNDLVFKHILCWCLLHISND